VLSSAAVQRALLASLLAAALPGLVAADPVAVRSTSVPLNSQDPRQQGDVLILERAYNPQRGIVNVRVRQIGRDKIRPGSALGGRLVAEFAPPVTLDNYEGISAVRDESGETHVYLVSDDNFNSAQQRTLLLMFALRK